MKVVASPFISFSASTFTGKETDCETDYSYFGARYYDPTLLTSWTAVDPMADKYPSLSPYNYCAWNPMKLVDPDGMDTLNVNYDAKTNKWTLGNIVPSSGTDVINVTGKDGICRTTKFYDGTPGNRICLVTLEGNENQHLGVFMLSGAGVAGFSVECPGVADNTKDVDNGDPRVPVECGVYDIGSISGNKWNGWPEFSNASLGLKPKRGTAIHYAWSKKSKSQSKLKAANWSAKCIVVSSAYTMTNGVVYFNGNESKKMAQQVAQYCGATGFIGRKNQYDQCIGISNCNTKLIIK